MREHLTARDANPGLDPRRRFGGAWAAAFLGVVLIIATVFWVANALT
jgi:hypothetical protein